MKKYDLGRFGVQSPRKDRRLSLCLTGLWTYVQDTEMRFPFGVLVEVQAARKLAAMQPFIVAA